MHTYPTATTCLTDAVSLQASAAHKAVAIILAEHQSVRVVLQQMQSAVRNTLASRIPCDCTLLRLMLEYIRTFPEAMHHPKEDHYLFAKLRRHTGEFDQLLAELGSHHDAGDRWLDALEAALTRFESGFPPAFETFSQTLDDYSKAQLQHMQLEESEILPAAIAQLSVDEWEEIAVAFGANRDSRFTAATEKTCRNLYAKIARLTTPVDAASGVAA